jgi:hypothetical protein
MTRRLALSFAVAAVTLAVSSRAALAGPIFLTGHDPDFHSQGSVGAQHLLEAGLDFVTGNTEDVAGHRFLWVESRIPTPGGHLIGENGLASLGLTLGVNYDRANAAELATVNFSNYTAIVIASSFGGLLTSAELNELIARQTDIQTFINAGGGLFASAECISGMTNCDGQLMAGETANRLFGYLPITVPSISESAPFTVTAFGASLGLVNGDVNDPTHNSFGPVPLLNVVDQDAAGHPTTLAGNVRIGDGGFVPDNPEVPEPSTIVLLGSGVVAVVRRVKRGRSSKR